jgi:hypothetical protein
VRSVFNFIASMRMEQANHLLAPSSTTSAKGKMPKPITTVVNKSPLKKIHVKTTRAVDNGLMKHIEDMIGLATHLNLGISRRNPLFKPAGKVGEEHIVCAPAKATVQKTREAFLRQQSNF